MKTKKLISFLLVICMVLAYLPCTAQAVTIVDRGVCGDDLTWVLDGTGTLTISGNGEMTDNPWRDHYSVITNVVIDDGVTIIGEKAFSGCSSLASVVIPDSVTGIYSWAFERCSKLAYVSIPESVTSMGIGAFAECPKLKTAGPIGSACNIEYGWTEAIPGDALSYCGLTSVEIPNGITSIGYGAFYGCGSLTSITIPDSVTSIGGWAFQECGGLTSVSIPYGVTNIDERAFADCSSLVDLTIPGSVTIIGEKAFSGCSSLASVMISDGVTGIYSWAFERCSKLAYVSIPESVTSMGIGAFAECPKLKTAGPIGSACNIEYGWTEAIPGDALSYCGLTSVEIPNGITSIGGGAFYSCDNLASVALPLSVVDIGYAAFDNCKSITDVYYEGAKADWATISFEIRNTDLTNATIHYNSDLGATGNENGGAKEFGGHWYKLITEEMNWIEADEYCSSIGGHLVTITSEGENSFVQSLISESTMIGLSDASEEGVWTWVTGEDVTYTNWAENEPNNEYNEDYALMLIDGTWNDGHLQMENRGFVCEWESVVVKPNALHFTSIYDTKQYYHAGAFYSAASSISDSVEIFVQFENKQIEGYPCEVEEDLRGNVSTIEPITLTATVSGTDLSFDRDSYQNTYSATYDSITFDGAIYDLLMLFPYDIDSFEAGSSYVVEVTLESESFDVPLIETYSFTVFDAEKQRVAEHLRFINENTYYSVSKQNIYGENMLELKDDPEYNWSVVTSLDFDNYYEIVLADLLVDMLDVYQVNTSIVPTVLKEWHGTYKSLLGDVTTMVKDSYSDVLDVSEMKIDKILKVSKYTKASDGIYADDDVYQVVLDMFGNVGNVDKIQTLFAAVDDTKSAFSIVKLTGDVVKDFVAWGNTINVLNAFAETDDNFKQVFMRAAENIPDSESKMKEAIEDYLNYSYDYDGFVEELYESINDLTLDITLDVFDGIVGKKLWDWTAAQAVGWIGRIPISGGTATFASTTAYASLTTAIGSVTTGISLGLCLSDLICDSSDKAAEMSKMIAMSEYAPYIVQTLEYYEDNLYTEADNDAVDLFEKAFDLHQASQSYIMEHTVKALEVKGESILYIILGNDDYDELVADILVQKNAIDNMRCCGMLSDDTTVRTTKVIAIKCPVNVYVYNGSGEEIVRIIDDSLNLNTSEITAYTRDREKFISLPANQVYTVRIVATDDGTMEYSIFEFDEQMQLHRTVRKKNIHLVDGRIFTGEVVSQLGVDETSYELTCKSGMAGDINGDGKITVTDLMCLANHLAGKAEINEANSDLDGNGKVTVTDLMRLANFFAGKATLG